MYKYYKIKFSFQNNNSNYYWEKEFHTKDLDLTIEGYLSQRKYFGFEEITKDYITFKIIKNDEKQN